MDRDQAIIRATLNYVLEVIGRAAEAANDPMMRGTHMALTKKADDIIAEVQKRI